jgi:hypothetical protein
MTAPNCDRPSGLHPMSTRPSIAADLTAATPHDDGAAAARHPSPDGFPIALTLFCAALYGLGQTAYERLAQDVIVQQLTPWIGSLPSGVLERATAVVFPAIMALGVVIALFRHLDRSLQRRLGRVIEAATRTAIRKAADKQARAQRDVWLYDAICRIYLGRWDRLGLRQGGTAIDADSGQVLHDLVTQHVRQLAFEGRIPIWGKASGRQPLWELAPVEFWQHHQVDYQSFLEADPRMLQALPCSSGGRARALRELMTNKAAIDAFCASVAL